MMEDSKASHGDVIDVVVDEEDFYHVLGVPRDASEKQINIAYKKLALKFHPDRNVDDEYAATKFKAVNEAYSILVDPNKRRQYDQRGSEKVAPTPAAENLDVTSLSGIGRVFGAVISRFTIPLQAAPDIVNTAQSICRNGGIEGGGPPLDPRVSDLPWGWAAEAKADRQVGAYYRVTVDPQHAETGFIIHCRSISKGKFKMILFDRDGAVLHQEESSKEKELPYTHGTFFFTTFDTYRLGEPTFSDKTLPSVFHKLETFTHTKKKIIPGQYLLCVYGDNFLGKTSFSIIAVPAKNDSPEVQGLEDADECLVETKSALDTLKNEYISAKLAYEKVLEKIAATEEKLDGDLHYREKHYTGFIDASIREFAPITADFEATISPEAPPTIAPPPATTAASRLGMKTSSTTTSNSTHGTAAHANSSTAGPSANSAPSTAPSTTSGASSSAPSTLGYLTANTMSVASNAASVTTNAAQTATAAGGWFARRFSLGLQSMVKMPSHTVDELGILSDDSVNSGPDRVMSPDGFCSPNMLASPPNETDNYYDAALGPASPPSFDQQRAMGMHNSLDTARHGGKMHISSEVVDDLTDRSSIVGGQHSPPVSLQEAATAAAEQLQQQQLLESQQQDEQSEQSPGSLDKHHVQSVDLESEQPAATVSSEAEQIEAAAVEEIAEVVEN